MKEAKIDPMNVAFGRAMEVFTYIGLVLMVVPGVIYIITGTGYIDVERVIANWDKSTDEFWNEIKGVEVRGYSWFMNNLSSFDCLSIVGIVILAVAPLVSIIAAIPKSNLKYRVILAVVIIEFMFAIVRPLIMQVTGH